VEREIDETSEKMRRRRARQSARAEESLFLSGKNSKKKKGVSATWDVILSPMSRRPFPLT
jgi:hypothetical protein